jgi:hypothetical protein
MPRAIDDALIDRAIALSERATTQPAQVASIAKSAMG